MGGGGMLLALGISAALVHVKESGEGQVVDAAMTDGTAIQLAGVLGLLARGRWRDRRGSNILDGAAPFYRTYRCADDTHVAVGCLEPEFYAALLRVLELADDPVFARQYDESAWPAMCARLEERFATRPRDEWADAFSGQEACVTPVLSLAEATAHPQNVARRTYAVDDAGAIQPGPAPRFRGTPASPPRRARVIGADTATVLAEAGLGEAEIDELRARGVVA
jgi:alpha-methylacyl-CoA racemase